MNKTTAPYASPTHPVRRALAIVVAIVLASLAFGVGLPWIIVDAPPEAETLWAREMQARVTAPLPHLLSAGRPAPMRAMR